MPRKQLALPKLENLGSLITFEDDEGTHCLGYLMHFKGHGVYDATLGRVDVSPEDAEKHNHFLDEGMINGLDDQCEVGEGSIFYVSFVNSRWTIRTFTGALISDRVRNCVKVGGTYFTFARNGRKFRGRKRHTYDGDDVFFKRIE